MAYELNTRTGRSFYEVTSAMQNSIRKGEYEIAGYCLWEMLPQYESYLRKRLLVISAEDCFGVITKEILNLVSTPGNESLERAVSMLCEAKKNRDADYFVCNLMAPAPDATKEKMAQELLHAIQNKDAAKAGIYCYGLFKKNRKYLWSTLNQFARAAKPELLAEFHALQEANERVSKPTEETIFVAKAIVLLWTDKDKLAYPGMRYDGWMEPEKVRIIKPCGECQRVNGLFPEWAYNWHTYHGKYKLMRDAIHAITNDQKILTPLEENLFDDCSWDKDINACLKKWNPKKVKLPYTDGKRKPEEKFPGRGAESTVAPPPEDLEQMSLFDY